MKSVLVVIDTPEAIEEASSLSSGRVSMLWSILRIPTEKNDLGIFSN